MAQRVTLLPLLLNPFPIDFESLSFSRFQGVCMTVRESRDIEAFLFAFQCSQY